MTVRQLECLNGYCRKLCLRNIMLGNSASKIGKTDQPSAIIRNQADSFPILTGITDNISFACSSCEINTNGVAYIIR